MSVAWPAKGRRWTHAELSADAAIAVAEFRARRLGEPLARYLDAFDATQGGNAALIARLGDVLSEGGADTAFLKSLWSTEAGRTAFRYLGASPISQDDLQTLAETKLSAVAAQDEAAEKGARLLAVMRTIVDPRAFRGSPNSAHRPAASCTRRCWQRPR